MAGGAQLLLLDDLIRSYQGHNLASIAQSLLIQQSDEKRVAGIVFRAGALYQQGETMAALSQLISSRRLFGLVPLPVIANIVWLAQQSGQEQTAAWECYHFAKDAFRLGYPNLGMEAMTAAYILDGMARFELIRSPEILRETGQLYAVAAMDSGLTRKVRRVPQPHSGPIRVALVVPNLVDHVVAYTRRVVQYARHLDRNQFQMSVYVSENLSARENPGFPFGCVSGHSEITGAHTINALKQLNVPVVIMSRKWSCMETGRQLAMRLDADQVDVALFQSGMACPIDWIAAYASAVPVKVGIHIGSSYYGAGLDCMVVDNPENLKRETNWDASDGERIVMPKGVDFDVMEGQPPVSRTRLGIPEEAVLVGTMSNHLDKRLSPEYLEVIAGVMKKHPQVWFVPIGCGTLPDKVKFFQQHGLEGRVRFAGRHLMPAAILKVLDIYASEFPVGGSQSVMEAMACGLPVVAMKWGDAHAESVATELIGEPHALPERDLDAYAARLEGFITSVSVRQDVGNAMRMRARKNFDAAGCIRKVIDHGLAIRQLLDADLPDRCSQ